MSALSLAPARWPVALGTTLLWTAAAAAVVFWALKLAAPSDAAPPAAPLAAPLAVNSDDVARALGAPPASSAAPGPDAGGRYVLLGVVADGAQQGAALIQIDGQPPRPFAVGADLGGGYVLQSVDRRAAALGARMDAPTSLTLRMPKPVEAPGVIVRGSEPAPQ